MRQANQREQGGVEGRIVGHCRQFAFRSQRNEAMAIKEIASGLSIDGGVRRDSDSEFRCQDYDQDCQQGEDTYEQLVTFQLGFSNSAKNCNELSKSQVAGQGYSESVLCHDTIVRPSVSAALVQSSLRK